MPLISAPVQGQYLNRAVKNYPHLANLQLANDCEGDAPSDLLVGADQYWNLVTGGVIREESGPTAIDTKLGWVLSGPVNEVASLFFVEMPSLYTTGCKQHRDIRQNIATVLGTGVIGN